MYTSQWTSYGNCPSGQSFVGAISFVPLKSWLISMGTTNFPYVATADDNNWRDADYVWWCQ